MPPRLPAFTIPLSITAASQCPKCCAQSRKSTRYFSTAPAKASRAREAMWRWLNGPGSAFKDPLPGSTNYLCAYTPTGQLKRAADGREESDEEAQASGRRQEDLPPEREEDLRPFRMNRNFRSQAVLSEELREVIWDRVMKQEMSVARVSRDTGVEMNRVGAVVRLKELEKRWVSEGRKLAKPYAKAVMAMLPQTRFNAEQENPTNHESINDLPVHKATGQQIFYPTSESRRFTRTDAAKVFDRKLLPAEKRIPHPEMIEMKKDELLGMTMEERIARVKEREEKEQEKRALRHTLAREREEKALTRVKGNRWEFRFKEISADEIGADGRGARATGFRYGAPHMDRKRGQVKIPTRVL